MPFLFTSMNILKALQSVVLLKEYCQIRHGVVLGEAQLQMLISHFLLYPSDDPSTWLKTQLIKLKCFQAGCKTPPPLSKPVTFHFSWKGDSIPFPFCGLQFSSKFFNSFGGDRRRRGRDPGFCDKEYEGERSRRPMGKL